MRFKLAHQASIHDSATLRDGRPRNELDSVGASRNAGANVIGKLPKFIGQGLFPLLFGVAIDLACYQVPVFVADSGLVVHHRCCQMLFGYQSCVVS